MTPRRRDAVGVGVDVDGVAAPGDVLDAGVQAELAAHLAEVGRVGLGHAAVVDDAGLGRPDGLDARGVGLDLPQALATDEFQPLHSVGLAAREEFVQARDLRLVGGDDHLAAHLVVDAALVAVLAELEVAGVAEPSLLGAGSVVDSRVDDAAVVAGLVLGDLGLFFQHDEPAVGVFAGERHRCGEADDASADDGHVVLDRSQSHSLRVLANRRG